MAKKLVLDVQEAKPLAEVVRTRRGLRIKQDVNGLNGSLFASIGRGRAKESALLPMLNDRDVLTILYGDNPASGKPLGKLRGVELFIATNGAPKCLPSAEDQAIRVEAIRLAERAMKK